VSNAAAAAFLAFLLYAVLSLAANAWDAESATREAVDRCLAFGGTVTTCTEVQP